VNVLWHARIRDTEDMAKGTPAIRVLEEAGTAFTLHEYEVDEGDLSYGEAVAAALGVDPQRLFKTLVANVDDAPVIGIVPVAGRLSLKRLAAAAGGKRGAMVEPAAAQRLTGYVVGGISPFGQRRRIPVYVDDTAFGYDTVFVSAGRRGLQVEVAPEDLAAVTGAVAAAIAG
jgi:Cys-tRNA(Pro)/Cys-tRNA(Cys) deacylase